MLKKAILLLVMIALVLPVAAINAQEDTIIAVATKDGRFTTLLAAVEAAGLTDTLNGAGPFTLFAPTDDAFKALPADVVSYLLGNKELLTKVLTFHVVAGETAAADVAKAATLKSVEGGEIKVTVSGEMVKVNSANVVAADVKASNGIIHAIDEVILPEIALPEVDPLSVQGNIIAAGSSTVYPVTERMADLFSKAGFDGNGTITVDSVGTGAGFERFCKNKETDISNASRAIKTDEVENCLAGDNPRQPVEFYVAIDAMAIVINKENTFLKNITKEQLAQVFSGEVTKWNEVDASYPAEDIKLFSPGTDSGTFDYFVEVIFAQDKNKILNAPGIQLSEDDNVLVQGVEGNKYAIGYFGYAYYLPNADRLGIVSVNDITPSFETAEANTYPLSRPLFIYTTAKILQEKPQVAAFVNFYLSTVAEQLGTSEGQIGYFPTSSDTLNLNRLQFLAATATK